MQHLKEFNYALMKLNHFSDYLVKPFLAYIKCIELTGFFSIFETSPYCNYVRFSNKLKTIIRAILTVQTNCTSDIQLPSYSVEKRTYFLIVF